MAASLFSVMTIDSNFFLYWNISLNGMQIISPHLRKCYMYVRLWRKYSFRVCIIYIIYEMFACVKKVYYILKIMGSNIRPNSPHHLNHKPITIPPTDGLLPVSRQCFRWCYFKAPQTLAFKNKVNINLLTKHLPTYSQTVILFRIYRAIWKRLCFYNSIYSKSRKIRKTYWSNHENKE